jgi:hypothetical protein
MLSNVHEGMLRHLPKGTVKKLRLVALPPKTQPTMNNPRIGVKRDDPGKVVLGTVPVEKDGSAYFHAPSGMTIFFQALDKDGVTIQTMRSATYLMPGQTRACVGCHESKYDTPSTPKRTLAAKKPPAKLTPGPAGSWPLRFDKLVQPVLNKHCVKCHNGKADPNAKGKKPNFTQSRPAYDALMAFKSAKKQSLAHLVKRQNHDTVSLPNKSIAQQSALLAHLRGSHKKVKLSPEQWERLLTWMDTYAQYQGHFSDDQEKRLEQMKTRCNAILNPR